MVRGFFFRVEQLELLNTPSLFALSVASVALCGIPHKITETTETVRQVVSAIF